MICELCGKKTDKLYTVIIEGVKMQVCEECAKFGKIVEEGEVTFELKEKKEEREEEELVEDWREKIRKKVLEENKKGKSIEEIAKEWKVKESLLRGILGGDIEISLETAKKFERITGEKLIRKVKIAKREKVIKRIEEPVLTLGDIVRIRVRS